MKAGYKLLLKLKSYNAKNFNLQTIKFTIQNLKVKISTNPAKQEDNSTMDVPLLLPSGIQFRNIYKYLYKSCKKKILYNMFIGTGLA